MTRFASLRSVADRRRRLLVSTRQQCVFRCVSTKAGARHLPFLHGLAIGSTEWMGR